MTVGFPSLPDEARRSRLTGSGRPSERVIVYNLLMGTASSPLLLPRSCTYPFHPTPLAALCSVATPLLLSLSSQMSLFRLCPPISFRNGSLSSSDSYIGTEGGAGGAAFGSIGMSPALSIDTPTPNFAAFLKWSISPATVKAKVGASLVSSNEETLPVEST
jgi:hypothetical protein